MRRKRRFGADEINLTPLLDVLFVVLFTILLSGFSQQSQNSDMIQKLETQIDTLQEQVLQYKNRNDAFDMYARQVIILSVDNLKRENQHILRICRDEETKEIVLGNNNMETVKRQINSYINDLLDQTDEQPIYIVFTCDENNIYKIEYDAIEDEMKSLESRNKEIFYKINE